MTPQDPENTTPQADAAGMSRREVLKELSKAPLMGALLLPSAWATPLMEFAQVGTSAGVSIGNGIGVVCDSTTSASIPLPAGDVATAQFTVSWHGVSKYPDAYGYGYTCTITLTRSTGKAEVSALDGLTAALVSGPATINGTTLVDWTITAAASPKITVALAAPSRPYGGAKSDFGDGTNSFVMDLQITGSGGDTLEITRYESRQC